MERGNDRNQQERERHRRVSVISPDAGRGIESRAIDRNDEEEAKVTAKEQCSFPSPKHTQGHFKIPLRRLRQSSVCKERGEKREESESAKNTQDYKLLIAHVLAVTRALRQIIATTRVRESFYLHNASTILLSWNEGASEPVDDSLIHYFCFLSH